MRIIARSGEREVLIQLNESRTAAQIYEGLPLDSRISVWGDEIYFKLPLNLPPENPTTNVKVNDVCYWPQGSCLCIFFGPTPLSDSSDPVPASSVTIIGSAECEISELKEFREGEKIALERA